MNFVFNVSCCVSMIKKYIELFFSVDLSVYDKQISKVQKHPCILTQFSN